MARIQRIFADFFSVSSAIAVVRLFYATLFFCLLLHGCKEKHATTSGQYASNRTFSVKLNPFWGGSAACELERKSGKDNLVYTYTVKKGQTDSSYSSAAEISPVTADSVFMLAEKINWLATSTFGTADPKAQLTVSTSLKIGKPTRTLYYERLANVSELPEEIRAVLAILNRIAPPEFKLY
jgi:hypothetical protein